MTDWIALNRKRYAHIPIKSLEELRALPGPQEYDSGVYFLWADNALIYIGRSRNLCQRMFYQKTLNRHAPFQISIKAKPIYFDAMTCLVLESGTECSPHLDINLRDYERAYIAAYEPAHNQDYQDGVT